MDLYQNVIFYNLKCKKYMLFLSNKHASVVVRMLVWF